MNWIKRILNPPGPLSDRDLLRALKRGEIVLDPPVKPDRQIQPASIDLRLGHSFHMISDTGNPTQVLNYYGEFRILPGQFVLATTIERVRLADDLLGVLAGRSSVGRAGVQVENAGVVDPGWDGQLTLELCNQGKEVVALYPGMRIVQMVVYRLTSPAVRPYGHPERKSKYQGQRGATPSKLALEIAESVYGKAGTRSRG